MMNKNILAALSLVTLLSGCSVLSVGQDEFNCSAGDENALCASSRTIYRATDGEIQENEKITYVKDGEVHQTNLSELKKFNSNLGISENSAHQAQSSMKAAPQFSYDGEVLRHDVKVLRVWIAPWIDKSDNLHSSQLIYTDIEQRKWEIGRKATTGFSGGFKPHLSSKSDANNVSVFTKDDGEHPYRPSETDLKDLAKAGQELMENLNQQK
jgi:conjugal transfer pilus assembly protein TraV